MPTLVYETKRFAMVEEIPVVPEGLRSAAPSHTNSFESRVANSGLTVIYRPTNSLRTNKRNARTHSKGQIRKIKESIAEFGFLNPILVDNTGTVVAGHGRLQAAKLLNLPKLPTICLEDLSPDQIRAYMLADNRLALDAGWDSDLLKVEVLHLSSLEDLDISVTGFEVPELDIIIGADVRVEDPADCLPLEGGSAVSKLGDLWLLGDHRLYCGDARQVTAYDAVTNGHRASMVFTDPPYNVAIDGHVSGNGRTHHREFEMASGEMTTEEFTDFLTSCLGNLARCSVDGAIHFVAMDFRHMSELLSAGERVYSSLMNLCVWCKDKGGMGSFYRSQHELIFVFKVGKGSHRNNIQLGRFGRYRTNVWNYPSASTLSRRGEDGNLLAIHPTVKPVALIADAILDCSARGDIILDAFLGSGSALLAAERTRRICYGLEIDPLYIDLAIRRWQDLTGESACHAESGATFNSACKEEPSDGKR
jgi:DNA modification methylase